MAEVPKNVRRYFNPTPGSVASIIAAAYSVPGVQYAFVIEEMGAGTVVIESDEPDIEPVRSAVETMRPAGVEINTITLEELGPFIEQRVEDALTRQAVVFKKAATTRHKKVNRWMKWIGVLGYGLGMLIGWLYGAHG